MEEKKFDIKQWAIDNNIFDLPEDLGEISDGYHTFNSLYHQRCILFAALCNTFPTLAWKSYRHEDGAPCFGGGWFIVGINTPQGPYTYHYENKDWDLFKCEELETAPKFDGHTDEDVERLLSLDRPDNSMYEWAAREVSIAIERETSSAESSNEWDYGVECYNSALRAFNSLTQDGHSGCSISITKGILNRLIDGQPLTPITDGPEDWIDVSRYGSKEDGYVMYQSTRMSSLFKYEYANGDIVYRDSDQAIGADINNPNHTYHSPLVSKIIRQMFPIAMPYMPGKPIIVYCEDFLSDPNNGDFDTVGIFSAKKPDGEEIRIDRYFKESETGWDEIDQLEYNKRKEMKV